MSIKHISKYFSFNGPLFLILGIFFFLIACIVNTTINKPIIQLSKQETALNINQKLLVFSSAGNKRLLTDLIWIQTLIESDDEHYKKQDLNSWLYLRFSTIAILDPNFYENYLYGGQFLAIVKDDLLGANEIYEKGLRIYPDDYKLNYNAGFLNYYEIGDYQKGIKYLSKIVNHPKAPVFINSIINKLLLATGVNLEEVFKLVLHNYENTADKFLRKKLRSDLYAIKAEIDLDCLNNHLKNCEKKDLDGKLYLLKGGRFLAPKEFRTYRIKSRRQSDN